MSILWQEATSQPAHGVVWTFAWERDTNESASGKDVDTESVIVMMRWTLIGSVTAAVDDTGCLRKFVLY